MNELDKNKFFSYLMHFLPSKNEELERQMQLAQAQFKTLFLKKNDFFVKQDQVCEYFCFIESGVLQHAITLDEEEKTTYLSLTNTATASLHSFLNQSPSRKSIKALTNCTLWIVDLPTFRKLTTENNAFHQFYFQLIERQICLIDDYRIDLLSLTPEERYKKLLASEPHLLQEVPLHYLASFLGISSRHMSRIRKSVL